MARLTVRHATTRLMATARLAIEGALASYAQLIFARSLAVGAILLAATATRPAAALFGLAGLAAAAGALALLGVEPQQRSAAPYGPNALLVALGAEHVFGATPTAFAIALAASAGTVLLTAALTSASARRGGLPILALPFVMGMWVLHSLVVERGLAPVAAPSVPPPALDVAPLQAVLSCFGSLLFAPRPEAGALVIAAMALHSRIALALAAVGVAVVLPLAHGDLAPTMMLNAGLTAMALGGAWFVPSSSSFVLGAVGALLAAALTACAAAPLRVLGQAPLILPFVLAVHVVLLAMRQRSRDRSPKSVDFLPGTPEENLVYFRTRVARFRAPYAVAFHLPFRGSWTCTQGVDGLLTHREAWRYAFDFEVFDGEGRAYRGAGASVEDHHCFKLPVLATADGVVVKVENDVADNAVGGLDLARNWGNAVVLEHAPGLYSLVAHLARGSVRVRAGQAVRRGEVLGLCGSSGRSPRPHLHFQLQVGPQLGASTLPCRFSDAVVHGAGGDVVDSAATPREAQRVRSVEPDSGIASCFAFEPGHVFALRVGDAIEHIEADVDLLGHRLLRSRERGGELHFARGADGFTAFEVNGGRGSVLPSLRAALGRVPFDGGDVRWDDVLPARWARWPLIEPLRDVIAPFVRTRGLAIDYRAERRGPLIAIVGTSRTRLGRAPWVQTEAVLSPSAGIQSLEIRCGAKIWRAHAVVPPAESDSYTESLLAGSHAEGGSHAESPHSIAPERATSSSSASSSTPSVVRPISSRFRRSGIAETGPFSNPSVRAGEPS